MQSYNNYIQQIKNKKIQYISRCLDMIVFGFGPMLYIKTHRGLEEAALFALHLQCPFVFIKDQITLFEYTHTVDIDFEKFDHQIQDFYDKNLKGQIVNQIQINKDNSLEIQIGDILLSAFCMETEDDNNEIWRFFKRNEDCKHLVCYSDHIEY